jgi:hypothetical protein
METLTTLIDNYNYNHHAIITPESIHSTLWEPLNNLRIDSNRESLLENWKYKTEFTAVENSHVNGNKEFALHNWEISFTLAFWMCIYH